MPWRMTGPYVRFFDLTTGADRGRVAGGEWLIGFAPADNPKVAVAVVVPAQAGLGSDTTGAQIAGPIFKTVLQAALASPQAGGTAP